MKNYLRKYKEIINGYYNYLTDNPEVKELAIKRANICANCPLNVNNICSSKKEGIVIETFTYLSNNEIREKGSIQKGCGCPLSAKVQSVNSQCPINLWNE